MEEMIASCVPEAPVAVVSNQELEKLNNALQPNPNPELENLKNEFQGPVKALVANVDIVSLNNKEELPWSEIKEDALDFDTVDTSSLLIARLYENAAFLAYSKEADETVVIKEDISGLAQFAANEEPDKNQAEGKFSAATPVNYQVAYEDVELVTTNGIDTKKCAAATDAVIGMQAELIRTMSQYVQAVPDLSKLASTAECGAEKQQSVAEFEG